MQEKEIRQLLLMFLEYHYRENPFRKGITNLKDIDDFLVHNESFPVGKIVSDDFGIKISEVLEIDTWRKKFNSIPLEKLKLINDDGIYFKLDPDIIADFKFTGLDNFDFVRTGFYKNGFTG